MVPRKGVTKGAFNSVSRFFNSALDYVHFVNKIAAVFLPLERGRSLPFLWWEGPAAAAAAAKSLQLCPTLCDPIDRSPPGSLVPGILQARTLEWVAIAFSNAWKWRGKLKSLSWF